ncbi:SDR family oxidoreductase [Shewanella yunxiaonensis]|uniref:SDR family oxidoreductase n=1 Tax=Shewanella yunxiaonensis TaxID=2829809 RepID=A0ABX7YU54_9GAMM|nr:SDR family oxidoreductase [Shewanella yunxiaonensis]QUN06038.1 SDR family oxidoreductase [Shewanella yunxiaonensis]
MASSALQHKRVVVIGGSSGIGLRVAELCAEAGAKLLIVGRNQQRLAAAQDKLSALGAIVETAQVDAHDHQALADFFANAGAFDHLVSMVGDVMGGGFLSADMAVIRHVLESKFFTNVRIGQLAANHINQGGSLVFTSGTGGRAQDACGSYIGNLGINALVEGLAVELAPKARVNAVSPTWTVTPFWRDLPAEQVAQIKAHFATAIPMKRTAEIDELASAYLFLITNGFITGQHIAVDGGIMLGA